MANILVTGGSRGIGAAVCRLAADRGHNVAVNFTSDEIKAQSVVAYVEKSGGRALAIKSDMSREEDVISLYEKATSFLGSIDVVVNNAGISAHAPIFDTTIENIYRIIDINVVGVIVSCREAARRMALSRGGKGGVIINVGSAAARTGGFLGDSVYTCSKGAVDTLSHALSNELAADGIRVVPVRPGITMTDIFNDGLGRETAVEQARKTIPLGRPGEPEEVAALILWLASPEASFITGHPIDVSGGR